MFQKEKNEKLIYGIIGLGRFGYALAMELASSNAELIVIDSDEEKIRELREVTENTFVVKKLDKKTLLDTGIQNCDVAVVCIGEHMDTSILTTLNLVSLGIPTVISKATSAEHGIILSEKRYGNPHRQPLRNLQSTGFCSIKRNHQRIQNAGTT
jgi:trk system potassium uptake protein TrkA